MFRGLDIGTAKVSAAERARVPHHGLDLVDPDQPFSVADFVRHARRPLPGSASGTALPSSPAEPGCTCAPSLEGSTPTRSRAIPRSGHGSRRSWQRTAWTPLVDRLRQLAPTRAAQIDLRNPRRVVRALEIAELQGDAGVPEPLGYDGPVAWLGLTVEPGVHERWIAERARAQFDAGLIEEAGALRERFDPSLPCLLGDRLSRGVGGPRR